MRIWIAISAYLLLLFSVCSIALTMSNGLQAQWVNLLILALAVHDIFYLRVVKTDPARGYRHLAIGQFLIGLLITVLVGAMVFAFSDEQLWLTIQDTLAQLPNFQNASAAQIDELMAKARSIATTGLAIGAAAIFISQTAFALFVWRRAKASEPK